MIDTWKGSDILLEIRTSKKGEKSSRGDAYAWTMDDAIQTLREKLPRDYLKLPTRTLRDNEEIRPSHGFTHVLITPEIGISAFSLHKTAGGVKRYFITGTVQKKTLKEIVQELKSLEFETYIIADLLNITDSNKKAPPFHELEKLEKKYGTRRVFSGDFSVVVLARSAKRHKK